MSALRSMPPRRHLFIWMLAFNGVFAALSQAAEQPDPRSMVERITRAVTERLVQSKDELAARPEGVRAIVRDLVVPHVDFPSLAAATLPEHWHELSAGERRCVADGVREHLVEHYARFLLGYEYWNIETDPIAVGLERGPVYVTQTVTTPHPQPLSVRYKMELVDGQWKLVDLIVAEVSLVTSYRLTYAEEIEAQGIGDFLRSFATCRER